MNAQPDLWTVVHSPRWSWPERYRAWRKTEEGKAIWQEFVRTAYEVMGYNERFGGKAIAEIVRWKRAKQRARRDARDGRRRKADFRINNSFVSMMVDDLIAEDPRFEAMFERRRRRAT